MASLVKKFKSFIELSDIDIERMYIDLFVSKNLICFSKNFVLSVDNNDILVLEIQSKKVLTYIEFYENYMIISTSRDFSFDEVNIECTFNLQYDATQENLFQLSILHDIGFIELKYMKYLKKLNELYSVEYN